MEEGEVVEEEDEKITTTMQPSIVMQHSCLSTKAIVFFSVNNEKTGRGGGRGGGDLNCNVVFRSNAAELYTHGQGDCFLLSNEQGREG